MPPATLNELMLMPKKLQQFLADEQRYEENDSDRYGNNVDNFMAFPIFHSGCQADEERDGAKRVDDGDETDKYFDIFRYFKHGMLRGERSSPRSG